ncbi:MAG: PilZ domain-containing protein [Hyphomicrobiales bacterium]|nr:PilZ domain-containing protein [Hyphomicrobiales bacterium]
MGVEESTPIRSYEERRRHARAENPVVNMTFGGETYSVRNWSLGGFMIDGYQGRLTPGALFTVSQIHTVDGEPVDVKIKARVLRRDPSRQELAVSFHDVDGKAYRILHDLLAVVDKPHYT